MSRTSGHPEYDWWEIEMWNRFIQLIRYWAQGQHLQLSDGEDDDDALDKHIGEMQNSKLRIAVLLIILSYFQANHAITET